MSIISTLAAAALASSPGTAQDPVWIEERTTQGCLFYLAGIDHGEAAGAPPPFTWSGACQPGTPINGAGVLEARIAVEGDLIVERWTGTMVDGYWHGSVRSERFMSENGGPLEPSSYSYDNWVPSVTSRYEMGCNEYTLNRRQCPARPQSASTDSSGPLEPTGGRIYGSIEPYVPTGGESGSNSSPIGTETGFSAAFLDPSGQPCVTAEALPTRSDRVYWKYGMRFTNICGRPFRVRLETIPHPEKDAEVRMGAVYANSTSSEFTCLERRNGSAQLTDCVGGYARWWLITTASNPEESAAQEAPRPPSR
ncbi:hypothetical protein [Brevundimonas sp.]|uniref:hypothetical protein n=1 Tax=Brevundimonas sp. TaxID=1871086 RepID=UPI001D9F9A45|nr:hypothetical protein [Brevundimonas sp.]MBL0948475.1 hypothetical protein [Brevundimonas sp.]